MRDSLPCGRHDHRNGGPLANRFGPGVGGLFLAFPAIFPASATLIEKHEVEKKAQQGLHGEKRGQDAAALDAFGATMGSVGLAVFALSVWLMLPEHSSKLTLSAATVLWFVSSCCLWLLRENRPRSLALNLAEPKLQEHRVLKKTGLTHTATPPPGRRSQLAGLEAR